MKTVNHTRVLIGCCLLLATAATAQEFAAFRIPDTNRSFLFITRLPSSTDSTNSAPKSVEGMATILAKRFKTTRRSGAVTVTFYDAIACQASRSGGEKLGDPMGSPVMSFNEWSIPYAARNRVLVHGHMIPLADLSEKSFDPPAPHYDTYTGEIGRAHV